MKKLRRWFLAFFVLLAVPCAILLWKAYANLESEAFSFYRRAAESAVAAFQRDFSGRLAREEERPFTQYRYIHVADQALPLQEGLNLSPLAAFPVESEFPGVLGYFQIDPDGRLRTPLLPDGEYAEGLEVADRAARAEIRDRISVLLDGELFRFRSRANAGETGSAAGKDEADSLLKKNLAGMLDASLDDRYKRKAEAPPIPEKTSPEEAPGRFSPKLQKSSPRQSAVFDAEAGKKESATANLEAAATPARSGRADVASGVREEGEAGAPELGQAIARDRDQDRAAADEMEADVSVTAEVDPFQSKVVGGQWLVFHRKVWWRDRRYVQGFAMRLDGLLDELVEPALAAAALPEGWSGLLFHHGQPIRTLGRKPAEGEKPTLLYEIDLPRPLDDLHLAVAAREAPSGPGRGLLHLVAASLATLLVGGLFGMYRLSASQVELSQKKSDFVAAVSHELKTPLASIRMYGEMLMEGWVDGEEKRRTYYRHIHDESERLSRLIQNVLRLAELERQEWRINPAPTDPADFVRTASERLRQQVERAGFELVTDVEGSPEEILVDADALTQILVNLVDNAIKFSRDAEVKKIQLAVSQAGDQCVIRVRDYGPGIPRRHLGKIFDKFHRVDAELTRKTRGAGIGLALVKMLAEAMRGRVEAVNRQPGAEFILRFPLSA